MIAVEKQHDVYAYGVVSSSTLYTLSDAFPSAEGYAEIRDVRHMTGGEAANSSIVLARLGATVKLDGSWIGADDNGKRTRAILEEFHVDVTRLPLRPNCTGVQEVVFAAQDTRTIFGTYVDHLQKADWNTPRVEDITGARVVCLDPFFGQPALRAAQVAADAGVPVVTVDCRDDDPLLEHVSAVVVADSFLRENYAGLDLAEVFSRYLDAARGLVIFTFGDAPLWYARPGNAVTQVQAYAIDPVDTAGGGDSFRAGVVYGFLHAWDDDRTIGFAAALAAMNCVRSPGVLNSPTYDEVLEFQASATGD